MTHSARVIADSISPDNLRITTLEVVFPRIVLAEFNTHRMFSRNSASSRAIPVEKMIESVSTNPYIPTHWGKNQKGMQADREINEHDARIAEVIWLDAIRIAIKQARDLLEIGVHKQITNRLLEPFMWHTVIITATEWDNFFHLRCNKDAHPEIRIVAEKMREAIEKSKPQSLDYGDWHLPYSDNRRHAIDGWKDISVGRCARVSYLTHTGIRDPEEDIALAQRLLKAGHMSPFEHVAKPITKEFAEHHGWWCGNFHGWIQYRKEIPMESDILGEQHERR